LLRHQILIRHVIAKPQASTVDQLVSDLRPGTAYRFRVRARDLYGWRSWDTALHTPLARSLELPPDAPSAPRAVSEACTSQSIRLAWELGFCNGPPVEEVEVHVVEDDGSLSSLMSVGRVRRTLEGKDPPIAALPFVEGDDDDDDDAAEPPAAPTAEAAGAG
jgi:hypothetical protein